jgi:hypothetical protein
LFLAFFFGSSSFLFFLSFFWHSLQSNTEQLVWTSRVSVCPFVNDLITYQHLNSWTGFYIIRYKIPSLQVVGKLQFGLNSEEKNGSTCVSACISNAKCM